MLETKTQFETESRNTSIAQNIKPKHKHSPKTQAETSKIEKRGKDGSGQRPSVGWRQWVCGSWVCADRRWVCGGRKKRWKGIDERDTKKGE